MQDYTVLRELAGSIGTVFLVLSFAGFVLYAFRPGARAVHTDTADIPFRHDDRPASLQDDDTPASSQDDTPASSQNNDTPASEYDMPAAHPKDARQ